MTHTKQFIIMDAPFEKEGFLHIVLDCGKVLSYQRELHIQTGYTMENKVQFCLLGWAFQADKDRSDPVEEVRNLSEKQSLEELLDTWSGRWLLIYGQQIYMDACGLLGCFYTETGIVSSSLGCLDDALGRRYRNPRLSHGFGLDYYPGMDTVYADTRRLLPSQTYDFIQKKCGKRSLTSRHFQLQNDEQRIDAIIQCFETILHNLERTYPGKIMLPLTGGYDSRTMMALLEHSKIQYSAFTMEHGNISSLDQEAPLKLVELTDREYQYIRREGKRNRKSLQEYDRHCSGMAMDEDRNFFAYDQYPHSEENIAILRAGVWESVYYTIYNWVDHAGFNVGKYKKKYINIRWRRDMQTSLEHYFSYVQENPQELKWPVRFYREQRVGCWLSSVEQSLTLISKMDSLQLCNCGCILGLLSEISPELLEGKKHEVKIIQKTCPKLLQVTLQNKENKFRKNSSIEMLKKDITYLKNCWNCLDGKGKIKEPLRFIKKKIRRDS